MRDKPYCGRRNKTGGFGRCFLFGAVEKFVVFGKKRLPEAGYTPVVLTGDLIVIARTL